MEESIYNLIPREEVAPPKQKRYVSQHANKARQEYKSKKEAGRTMGPPAVQAGDTSRFLKRGEGKGGGRVQRAAPQKREQAKKPKPRVPKATEKPPMGLRTKKDFIKDNAVKTMTTQPPRTKPMMLDTAAGKGQKMDLEESGLVPKYTKKKTFGKTPAYLTKRREEEDRAQAEYEEYVRAMQQQGAYYEVSQQERDELLHGLKTNWEQLHKEYQGLSVIADTAPKRQRRNDMEARLAQLEADIAKIERHSTILVAQ
ncbi:hypothetical protein PTSG_00725 [Salpingoeca rosetta]|uniref:Enkurin domain-containing protein n=1 Tax=Salpingoeca rosetta (strain ATCC 50818 / BSB-021) TaxID=946362 RepID=F2TXA8_SALR5|nr:uncharacterized protein PTSG_00725 [Salpingoeca rosetta]EGD76017.1 hypothetical protein PTSG_00725 [Salpingoeca rosetta]|eukprot:XP_004998192.1 hypothetical protein PTSG_00725 [Salpingoeca rosetta]